jgi:hypothetical protein
MNAEETSRRPMTRWRQVVCVTTLAVGAAGAEPAYGQQQIEQLDTQVQFSWGQNVAPLYEGWMRTADGTIDMWFGYLNRNWEEVLHVPVGPDNHVEPGGPERGQPTVFVARRREGRAVQRRESYVFRVRLPGDWDFEDEVVWTVVAHGKTDRAIGLLLPIYELRTQEGNTPPSVHVRAARATVALPASVALTATVRDDGEPEDRSGRARVTWVHYRGPGKVTFEPDRASLPEGAETSTGVEVHTIASFSRPGTYVLRAVANDGDWNGAGDVTVTVTDAAPRPGEGR